MTSTEKIDINLSDYKSTLMADMGLQNLFTLHTDSKYAQAEDLVEKLKKGEAVSISISKEGSTSFLRGLKTYKLNYSLPEN